MKHAKGTAKILGRVILAILILSLTLTGCGQENDNGFEFGYHSHYGIINNGSAFAYIAYKSDVSVFDIDDVTFEFAYGCTKYDRDYFGVSKGRIFFNNETTEVFVGYTEEDLSSDKYNVSRVYSEDEDDKLTYYEFTHSEKLTVPSELFTNDSGIIYVLIKAKVRMFPDIEDYCVGETSFHYEKISGGEQVKIIRRKYLGE